MSSTAQAARPRPKVTVTLTITDENGETQTSRLSINGGPTQVPALKDELGVPRDQALWLVVRERRRLLADHQTHNVKEGDHYEAIIPGGIS